MVPETICCPYCNSYVTVSHQAASPRVTCPRCGEAIPYRSAGEPDAAGESPARERTPDEDPFRETGPATEAVRQASNRSLALGIVGVMVAVAAGALGFALMTKPVRRSHDPVLAEGTALGYLPGDANVAASVRVREVLREPAGKELLDFVQLGPHDGAPEPLETWAGLKLEDLDTAVLGLRLTGEPSRAILILQTRRPYGPQAVQAALKSGRPFQHGERILYRISPAGLPFRTLWCAASNIIVLAMAPEDLDGVPITPKTGTDALPPSLKPMVDDQLASAGQAWLAFKGDSKPERVPLLQYLSLSLSPKGRDALSEVRTFGVAVRFDRDLALTAVADCTNEAAAGRVQRALKSWQKAVPEFSATRTGSRVTIAGKQSMDAIRRLAEVWAGGRKKR